MKYLSLLLLSFLLCSCGLRKTFPKFNLQDTSGKNYDESVFKDQRTVLIMGHLSCPPMMKALKDFDDYQLDKDSNKIQVIAILENTEDHILQFYQDTASVWGIFKKVFEVDTLQYPLLPECDTENITYKDSVMKVGTHCRKLSWKVWTFSSPTILLIDGNRKILNKKKGYPLFASEALRNEWIDEFLAEE